MSRKQQTSLFDEGASGTRLTLSEHLAGSAKPTDKTQAKLQRLIRQIEQQRALLKEWQDYIPVYQQTLQSEFFPLQQELEATQRAMVFVLDSALKKRGTLTGKVQRRQAGELIVEISASLLTAGDDPELEALHDEYNDLTYREEKDLESTLKQEMLSAIFGVQIEDGADDEAIFAALREQQEKLRNEQDATRQHSEKPGKKSSKRAQAAEALADEASLSVRQVFRKLASTLHPDREADPAERERKTALMQRVNDAYAKNDLLGLLSLQYEIEQIDTEHLAQLDARQQMHYIHLFTEQLAELKEEISNICHPFREMLNSYSGSLHPNRVVQALKVDIAVLNSEIRLLKQDLEDCQNKERLKQWIKTNYYQPADADDWMPHF